MNYEGLKKVLRERDGRWYWHWDPAFMNPVRMARRARHRRARAQEPRPSWRKVHVPTHAGARHAQRRGHRGGRRAAPKGIPEVQVVEVGGAAHMIAGDKNDQFSDAVIDFLERSVSPGR